MQNQGTKEVGVA